MNFFWQSYIPFFERFANSDSFKRKKNPNTLIMKKLAPKDIGPSIIIALFRIKKICHYQFICMPVSVTKLGFPVI